MFIYEGHMGSLYANEYDMNYEDLYCETCGESDWLIGIAETRKDAWKLLKPITDINGSSGWDNEYVQKFLDETFGIDKS